MVNLRTPIGKIPRILPKYRKLLEKIGVLAVGDLFFHFPFRHDDFSRTETPSLENLGKNITVEATVKKISLKRIFKRNMTLAEAILEDAEGIPLKAVWFNQPYLAENIVPETILRLSGKLELSGKNFSLISPAWEKASREKTNTGRLVPVYPETAGLSSKFLRWQIQTFSPLMEKIPDPVPREISEKFHLLPLGKAVRQMHFPSSEKHLLLAKKTLAFREMFLLQVKMIQSRILREKESAEKIAFDRKLMKDFVSSLPFQLTGAQKKASFEILRDLEKNRPMNRLLNGDVGAGKTVVAAMASLQTISRGFQVAIMAPTEVLARQHFESFCKLFENYNLDIALLTNSYKLLRHGEKKEVDSPGKAPVGICVATTLPRNELLKKISSGKISLSIGTHALIQKDIRFKNLALVVIDEQHRFGVAQRSALQNATAEMEDGNKKTIPHFLSMTATPIPRTLSIAFFGSLDISLLDELPKNRKPVITKAVSPAGQKQVYDFVRSEIEKGHQAFIIFPLVTESEKMAEVKAATQEKERLSEKIFPDLKVGLMHGKLKSKEKEEVMEKFKKKEFDILVSTSVVEVGVDVPNATVMIIENAERFGLSQLHQFRGRIGRGEHQSYCFLFSEKDARRLKTMEKTSDGFEIAEEDLKLRGPGQFFGNVQSGLPDIAMENLSNMKLIKLSREEADHLLKKDPELKEHPVLRDALEKFSQNIHLE